MRKGSAPTLDKGMTFQKFNSFKKANKKICLVILDYKTVSFSTLSVWLENKKIFLQKWKPWD